MKVSFIGLGVMGYPMAGHLADSGFDVSVFNRTTAKANAWAQEFHGKACETIQTCVQDADVVLVCVGNDDDVRSVTTQEGGAIAFMKPGSILVDHTTTSANLAIELNQACQQANIAFVDAPVSGGQSGAEHGVLTVMCGGQETTYQALRSVFNAYAKSSTLMGEVGQGQRAKMVNQMCIAGVLRGLSEGLLLAKESGLDINQLVDCLKGGAAGSWQMENRSETMSRNEFDFGFAIDWMIKDLGYGLEEAQRLGLSLEHTQQTYQDYQELSAQGEGRMDTSALIKAVAEKAKQ